MLRKQKEEVSKKLIEKFKNIDTAIFVDYKGLNVKEITHLRRKFREKNIDFKVVKNKIFEIVGKETNFEGVNKFLSGPTAIAFEKKGINKAVKVIIDFNKEGKIIFIKGGVVEGKILGKEETEYLAKIPNKEILISQLASVCQGPIRGLLYVLQSPIQKLIYALEKIKDTKKA